MGDWRMRGEDRQSGGLFSYVDLEARVPADHPLRPIRTIVDDALGALSGEFEALYSHLGRPSIAPERLLRALLLQAFYSVRSERLLIEQLEYNLLFRWFVGVGIDDPVWHPPLSRPTATGCFRVRLRPSSWRRCSTMRACGSC
jgi:transposase